MDGKNRGTTFLKKIRVIPFFFFHNIPKKTGMKSR